MGQRSIQLWYMLLMVSIGNGQQRTTSTPSKDDELMNINRLRKDLLIRNSYDRRSRPVKHHSTVLDVSYGLLIRHVESLDVKTNILTFSGVLTLKWTDEHLIWNVSDYGGIEDMIFSPREVWTLDFNFWSAIPRGASIGRILDRTSVRVNHEGKVQWWPLATFTSICPLDLSNYPADTQTCKLFFGTWINDMSKVKLSPNEGGAIYGPLSENSEWSTESTSIKSLSFNYTASSFNSSKSSSEATKWPVVQAEIKLKRRTSIYAYYIYAPYFTAIALTLTSFTFEFSSKNRVCLLSLSLFILNLLLILSSLLLGNHSVQVPTSVKAFGIHILMTGILLVLTSIFTHLKGSSSRLDDWIGHYFKNSSSWLRTIFCLPETSLRNVNRSDELKTSDLRNETGNPFQSIKVQEKESLTVMILDRLALIAYVIVSLRL